MSFKLEGTLKVKNDTVQVSEKFSKREFVVTDNSSMYPQDILFQLSQDKCALLDSIPINSVIEVSFNLRGREWTNPQGEVKYFNTLDAWKVECRTMSQQQNSSPQQNNSASTGDDDDLPF